MYGSVLQIGGKFRMWYLGMSQTRIERGQAPGWWRPMCYAESEDGMPLDQARTRPRGIQRLKKNNICLIESDPFALSRVNDFLSVLHEPDEPDPARRYKCAYIAHVPFEEVRGGRSTIGPNEKRWGAFVVRDERRRPDLESRRRPPDERGRRALRGHAACIASATSTTRPAS